MRQIYLESRRQQFHWANPDEMALQDFDRDTEEEHILVAEQAGHILGFVSLYVPENFIHLLFVHPDHFGKGAGTRLLAAAALEMNTPLRLKCVSENIRALAFYERNGWKKVIEEEKNGEKYWVMEYE